MDFFDALFITDSLCKIKRIFYQLKIGLDYLYDCRRYINSLEPKEVTQIETLYDFAQQFPETAITLHYVTTSYCVDAFLHCLHTEWKKSGGRKLDRLIIRIVDDAYHWWGWPDWISSYSMLAKSIELHRKEFRGICWID